MPTFAYAGRTRGGENVTGERIADNADAAVAALRREQILVTRIAPTKEKAARPPRREEGKLGKKANPKNLAVFVRQFSVMIDAGLPLVQCLEILGNQEEDKNFAETIFATRSDVESGASLADAMKKHPKIFDPLFTNMIAAGEAGGILDTILKRLATYIEKAVKLKGQVKSAMVYPLAVIVIAVRRRRRHSVEGHPDLRGVVRRTRRPAAAADAHRHRPEQLPGRTSCRSSSSASARSAMASRRTTGPTAGKHKIDGDHAEAAGARPADAEDRRRAVLPHAVDAAQLGRADSRRARHHGAYRRATRSSKRRSSRRARASSAAKPSRRL